jgi:competence protein ComEC
VLLTSIALLTGFLTLLCAMVAWPLAIVFGWLTSFCLAGCQLMVQAGVQLPGAYAYVSDIPEWWLWAFYGGLLLGLTVPSLRQRWPWTLSVAVAWVAVLLFVYFIPLRPPQFRCTFLAVGHGGCTIIETADGRRLLYDAGAMAGPEVTRRHIAPFLWHRGIRRLDHVFVSHADLDHFNGLPALLERFDVGQITWTPSFAERRTEAVRHVVQDVERRRIPTRVVKSGDQIDVGEVTMEVLHPPAHGPAGVENFRSMVLLMRYRNLSMLLTGDLEGPGLERVLNLPAVPLDVLMAPHHGSRSANIPELAMWARPKVVVSCQGEHLARNRRHTAYDEIGARFLGTWPHGAVTVRHDGDTWIVETYQTACRWPIK